MKPIPTEDGKGDYDMDLLKQCQQWFEQDEAPKMEKEIMIWIY